MQSSFTNADRIQRRSAAGMRLTGFLISALVAAACADSSSASSDDENAPMTAAANSPREASADATAEPYSDQELVELAHSPDVLGLDNPFVSEAIPDQAFHVVMADGERLALSLYFPHAFDRERDKAPVVYIESWYGRMIETTHTPIELDRDAGFIIAAVDPRGFGASFGFQTSFLGERQRDDERAMIAWLASQAWSTGEVAAIGRSASAMLAEAVASSGAPQLRAAIIRATEFDHYTENLFPGGVPNPTMIALVKEVYSLMRGEDCVADVAACAQLPLASVDGDTDLALLRAALGEHQRNHRGELSSVVYRDDAVGDGSFDDVSPRARIAQLRAAAVPARVSASWLDGTTAKSALARFAALPDVAMELAIGATTHAGGLDADPFSRSPFGAANPDALAQYGADTDFLRRVLSGEQIGRRIDYYVLGAGQWKTTEQWPPAGVRAATLYLSEHALQSQPSQPSGERAYQVDPETSSGPTRNRWASQGEAPVYYGDRRLTPGQRLAFDGAPFEGDAELAGAPELCLAMRTDQPDGTLIAYLEDVAPDGRVTYLSEGLLRLLHRKTASGGCDPSPGTERSFLRADGNAVTPGELMQIELTLLPVAAKIEKGHHMRLSLAGADAGTFPMLTDSPATWSVAYGSSTGSSLSLPLRPWSR